MSIIQQTGGRRGVKLEGLTGLMPITETTRDTSNLEKLRAEWGPVAPVELLEGVNGWLVLGYNEVCEMLRNDHTFSRHGPNWSAFADGRITPSSGYFTWTMPRQNCVHTDGEERRRLRDPIDQGLTTIDEQRVAAHVREVCEGIIGQLAVNGRADLMHDYAEVVPLLAVANMFGMDTKTAQAMTSHARKIFGATVTSDAAAALSDLQTLITKHMENRRAVPAPDLTTSYLNNKMLITEEETREAISITIIGGYELTKTMIVNTLLLMINDKRFSGRLRGGRLNIEDAMEEVLWREPPTYHGMPRFAKRNTILGGQYIKRGECLMPSLHAANHDPVMTGSDPWNEVGNRAHLSWSTGRHRCPAKRTGRIIVSTAVQVALDGLRDLQLAVPAEQLPRLTDSINTHYPTSLPVTFTPPRQQLRPEGPGRRRIR